MNRKEGMEPGNFGVGPVLSKTFSVLFSKFASIFLITIIVFLPHIIYMVAITGTITESRMTDSNMAGILVKISGIPMLLMLLLQPLAAASVTYAVFQGLRGRDAGMGECLRVGLSRMLPVLGVGLVSGLCIMLGTLACVVPGLIIATMFWVATPAAVVEKIGVGASLSRSRSLTDGHRWTIFGVLFVIGLINSGVTKILEFATGSDKSVAGLKLFLLLDIPVSITLEALSAVAMVVVYQGLRQIKEDLDIDQIASTFD